MNPHRPKLKTTFLCTTVIAAIAFAAMLVGADSGPAQALKTFWQDTLGIRLTMSTVDEYYGLFDLCRNFNSSEASVDAGCCGNDSICCYTSASTGGGCPNCGSPRASVKENVVYIEDTPFFFRMPNAPDLFVRWRYSSISTDDLLMGPRIKVTVVDVGVDVQDETTLLLKRGASTLALLGPDVYKDSLGICEAAKTTSGGTTTVTVKYLSDGVVQVFEGVGQSLRLKSIRTKFGISTTYNYDSLNGRLTSITLAPHTVAFTYNTGRLGSVSLKVQGVAQPVRSAQFTYNHDGTLASVTDMAGKTTSFTWLGGSSGTISSMSNNDSFLRIIATQIYRCLDKPPAMTDNSLYLATVSDGGYSTVQYFVLKHDGTVDHSVGPAFATQTGYIDIGGTKFPVWKTNGAGVVTFWAYDATSHRKTRELVTTAYTADNYSAWYNDPNSIFTREWTYTAEGKVSTETECWGDNLERTRTYTYYLRADADLASPGLLQIYAGEVKTSTDARNVVTKYVYEEDTVDAVPCYKETTIVDFAAGDTTPGRNLTTVVYRDKANGRAIRNVDAVGAVTKYQYYTESEKPLLDAGRVGKLKSEQVYTNALVDGSTVLLPVGPPTVCDYGMVTDGSRDDGTLWDSVTPPYQGTTIRRYDALDRLVTTTFPDGSTEERTYGCCRNVASITRKLNDTAGSPACATFYQYDGLLRTVEERTEVDTATGAPVSEMWKRHHYDAMGNRVSTIEGARMNGADGLLAISTNVYDAAGRLLIEQSRSGPQVILGDYTALGSPQVITNGNPAGLFRVEKRSYYSDGSLRSSTIEGDSGASRTMTFVYDEEGNKTRETDPLNRTIAYSYDNAGRLTSIHYDNGTTRSYTYDNNGNVVIETDESGNKTLTEYDAYGRVTARAFDMDNDGKITAPDAVTETTYNVMANGCLQVVTTGPIGHSHTVEYNAMGRPASEYDLAGYATVYDYNDYLGRLTKITRAGTVVAINQYDCINRIKSCDALNRCTQYRYDALDRLSETQTPDGRVLHTTYEQDKGPSGNKDIVVKETVVGQDQYLYFYDDLLQRTNVVHDTDRNGFIGVNDRFTITEYDAYGEAVNVYGYDTVPVKYSYDDDGNVHTIQDGNGNSTSFDYDARGRISARQFADSSRCEYTYTGNGLLQDMWVKKNGIVASRSYTYDNMNNPLTITSQASGKPQNVVVFTYNKLGQKVTMTDGNGLTTWSYWSATEQDTPGISLPKSETPPVPGTSLTYTYWPATGQRKSLSCQYPVSTIQNLSYTYDNADRLTAIAETRDADTVQYGYLYKPNWDLVSSVSATKGAVSSSQSFTYDNLGRRLSVTSSIRPGGSQAPATISVRTYGYDAAGQRTSQSISYSPPGGCRPLRPHTATPTPTTNTVN